MFIKLNDSGPAKFMYSVIAICLKTTKYIFYEEIKNSLIQIQKDIGFKHITLTNLFDEELRLFIKKEEILSPLFCFIPVRMHRYKADSKCPFLQ